MVCMSVCVSVSACVSVCDSSTVYKIRSILMKLYTNDLKDIFFLFVLIKSYLHVSKADILEI